MLLRDFKPTVSLLVEKLTLGSVTLFKGLNAFSIVTAQELQSIPVTLNV